MRLLLLVVALSAAAARAQSSDFDEEQEEDRGKRQTFAPRGVTQLPKGVPLPQQLRFPPPQAFRQAAPVDEDEELSRNIVTPTPQPAYRRPPPPPQDSQRDYSIQRPQPQPLGNVRRPGGPPPPPGKGLSPLEEEELEEEKPDRLSLLLPESKFDCNGKKTGYYADEGLNCEVFHYCQDNARHSWICPEGFLFHQVHLICMPPSSESICKQSSQYHFVNDYLYRPINTAEHESKPNVTLRYSDRYYPDNFYEEDSLLRQPEPVGLRASPAPAPAAPAAPSHLRGRPQLPAFRPQPAPHQVFHSPEEVNIPLQQRRPAGPPPPPPRGGFGPQHEDEYDYDDLPFRQG